MPCINYKLIYEGSLTGVLQTFHKNKDMRDAVYTRSKENDHKYM